MKVKKSLLAAVISTLTLTGCATAQHSMIDSGNLVTVEDAVWQNQSNVNPNNIINQTIPEGETSLVFIRRMDNDPKEKSANIAVNNRYQVSLHPNSYTQVNSCAGINTISVVITELKENNLMLNAKEFNLAPNTTNFFDVDIDDETTTSTVVQVDKQTAEKLLENKTYQAHQISRVQPKNCKVSPKDPIKAEVDKPINLHVEFDFDKATIRSIYNQRLAAVAQFMQERPNTVALIEGHTDSIGSNLYNQKLSEARAQAVKKELATKYGVNPNRLNSQGFGETRPVASNSTNEGRQRNRRVDALITLKTK